MFVYRGGIDRREGIEYRVGNLCTEESRSEVFVPMREYEAGTVDRQRKTARKRFTILD